MAQFISFGDGQDGSISSATGTINSYATMTGTAGSSTVTTTLSVSVGDMVLLHQARNGGSGAGVWELVIVAATGSGQFTADRNLTNTYAITGHAILVPQYSGGTCGNSLSATTWNGTIGGVLALACNGAATFSGTSNLNGVGYQSGAGGTGAANETGTQGEGTSGAGGTRNASANGNGGGGGGANNSSGGGGGGGGGGGNGTTGSDGDGVGNKGASYGNASLTTMVFGGGGGGGGSDDASSQQGAAGGKGGGLIYLFVKQITILGTLSVNGANGSAASTNYGGGGGGGAGGSIIIKSQIATLGSTLLTATGGNGGTGGGSPGNGGGNGGAGGTGRIHLDYLSSYTGTTNPSLNVTQDFSLADKGGSFLFLMT